MKAIYGMLAVAWLGLTLACVIVLPATMVAVPTLVCAGMALFSCARGAE